MSRGSPFVLLQETLPGQPSRWWRFLKPVRVIETSSLDEVVPALHEVESAVERGLHAVGFLTYEAGPAFDPALEAAEPEALPLTWWGLFEPPEAAEAPLPAMPESTEPHLVWRPLVDRASYEQAIDRIRQAIAGGDTYQVNFTFPLAAEIGGMDPFALFAAMVQAQRPLGKGPHHSGHAAFVDTGRFAICSASPELFFSLDGERIVARPMKGTARRGRYLEEDRERPRILARSTKDRAENVMIVDMVRNDLNRIARPGSVQVDTLCQVETYPTVHQLTSTVSAKTSASVTEILSALFPSASITGAPKIRTTRFIHQLEQYPRGVYTGTMGYLAPGRRAHFNVAIRTATVDRHTAQVRYGTGGGIVWDSDAASEYEECRTKAFVLRRARAPFQLLETLLWRPKSGYFLLDRHLRRMADSAEYFGFTWQDRKIRQELEQAAANFDPVRTRIRLLLEPDGGTRLEARPEPCAGRARWTIGLDDRPIDTSDIFWFHKTTRRGPYADALDRRADCDEVVLWNERGELTESTRANLVLKIGEEWLTPPVDCGLLAGTYRAELLDRGRLREARLPVEMLDRADKVLLINSVRGWIRTRRLGSTKMTPR